MRVKMSFKCFGAVALPILFLAGCGGGGISPEASIDEGCHRIAEAENANEKEADEVCACMVEKFSETLDKKTLKKVAEAFDNSENGQDFEENLEAAGIDEAVLRKTARTCRR